MNRPDLLEKYTEETGNCLELLEKLLDFTKTNLEVLKYIEWLEGNIVIEQSTDYIQETANSVIKLRFINEVKSRMTREELEYYEDKYQLFLNKIESIDYSYFLKLNEIHGMDEAMSIWRFK